MRRCGAPLPTRPTAASAAAAAGSAAPRLLLLLLLLLLAGCTGGVLAEPLAAPPVLSSGNAFASQWAATITVEGFHADNGRVSFATRVYCTADGNGNAGGASECGLVGPTIEVYPGDNLTLTLVNNLGPNPAGEATVANTMHSPNTTNLHTHGLHIDPAVDTIFQTAAPGGGTLVYNYRVPVNHAPGTHWYHDHTHGSSALKVMGGLVGAVIVRPLPAQNVPASLTAGTEHLLVLTGVVAAQTVDAAGRVSQGCGNGLTCDQDTQPPGCTADNAAASTTFVPFRKYSFQELSANTGSSMDPVVTVSGTAGDGGEHGLFLVNGQDRPTIPVPADGTVTLRVVAAHGIGDQDLEIREPMCSMAVVAMDGVYLRAVRATDKLILMAGSRADIQVTCASTGAPTTMAELVGRGATLAFLNVSLVATALEVATTDAELEAVARPYYLSDLTGVDTADVDQTYAVHMSQGSRPVVASCTDPDVFWFGAGRDCSGVAPWGAAQPAADSEDCPFGFFGGARGTGAAAYTAAHKLVTALGDVNEWSIYGLGADKHPLHLHVHHMQVVGFSCVGGDCGAADVSDWEDWLRVGEWRDVLPTFPGELRVRFRATDFTGETVLHCHFLRHEDLGMMDTVLVQDCAADAGGAGCASACFRDSSLCLEEVEEDDGDTGLNGATPLHSSSAAATAVALTAAAAVWRG